MVGQQVGRYRLTEKLGEGGMGVVFKGIDVEYGHEVAIKALHPELTANTELRERFVREAQALARLNHPNVVRLLDFIDRGDSCFIVMEFVRGQTVEQRMQQRGLIPPLEACDLFVQVLAAAHYAHGLGIVHRDVKPANIAVLEDGRVKLLDFGTAKVLDAERLTRANMTLGTLVYMSPEQVCGREIDHRSDIYSLGVTLYEMLTGKLPHDCEDEAELFREIVRGTPVPPSRHYPPLPRELDRIVMRAMEKDPGRRFQTAEEFLQAIRGFVVRAREHEARATPPSGLHPVPEGVRGADAGAVGGNASCARSTHPNWRRLAWSGAAGVGLAAAGTLGLAAGLGAPVGLGLAAAGVGVYVVGLVTARGGGRAGGGTGVRRRVGESTPPLPQPAGEGGEEHSLVVPPPEEEVVAPPPAPGSEEAVDLEADGAAAASWAEATAPAPPRAILYVFEGPDRGASWVLPAGAITIGRGGHNTIVLHDGGVSTTHAQIGFDGSRFVITDLESRNGTYVNGSRVHSFALGDRDVITMGQSRLAIALQDGSRAG